MKKSILTSLVCAATLAFFSSCANKTETASQSGGTMNEKLRSGQAGGTAGGGAGRGTGPSGSTDRPLKKTDRTVTEGGTSSTKSSKKKSGSGGTGGGSGSSGSSSDASPSPSPGQ
jgi:hypothetical protein